jgi:hypothetical protein
MQKLLLSLTLAIFSFHNSSAMHRVMAARMAAPQHGQRVYTQKSQDPQQYRQQRLALSAKQVAFGALGTASAGLAASTVAIAPLFVGLSMWAGSGAETLTELTALAGSFGASSAFSTYKVWKLQKQKNEQAIEQSYIRRFLAEGSLIKKRHETEPKGFLFIKNDARKACNYIEGVLSGLDEREQKLDENHMKEAIRTILADELDVVKWQEHLKIHQAALRIRNLRKSRLRKDCEVQDATNNPKF